MGKVIVANWKANPGTRREAVRLAKECDFPFVFVAPPFVYLEAVRETLEKASLAAQDVALPRPGGQTGQVTATELKDLGVKAIIIGHREGRRVGETDREVGEKARAVIFSGMVPIICVGEKEKGGGERIVRESLERVLFELRGLEEKEMHVAYEPWWAISTNAGAEADVPERAVKVIEGLREVVEKKDFTKVKFLYGGSVDKNNAEDFLKESVIEGTLVGGASLRGEIADIIAFA